jgi:hypothetical protein
MDMTSPVPNFLFTNRPSCAGMDVIPFGKKQVACQYGQVPAGVHFAGQSHAANAEVTVAGGS